MLVICGCAATPPTARSGEPASEVRATAPNAPFAPVRVRVLPLTRLVHESDGAARLDLHVELLDAWGLPTRALGTLRVVARLDAADAARFSRHEPGFDGVLAWTLDLTDPATNATRAYDRITRAYRVRLAHPALAEADNPVRVEVFFTTEGALVLPGSATITP
ncbi:MAG: hypothetical protein D6693_07680 [Planctomycetota bacterium]|nr:MAG: hypothetical protein D6693_07680 [Planctomycetota bacterium]